LKKLWGISEEGRWYNRRGGGLIIDESNDAKVQERWRKALTEGHRPLKMAHALFHRMPSEPRCKLCHNPFGGVGGKVVGLFGYRPSRKNPNFCRQCCDTLPPGGIEMDLAIMFADVRGSTTIAERMTSEEYAALLNRFYLTATRALIHYDAIIDKLIGDEVMALFIPGFCGSDYKRRAAEATVDLLKSMGYGSREPMLPIGASVHSGKAFVGNVGADDMVDFTALGDAVNTAARLQGEAKSGEIAMTMGVYESVADRYPDSEARTVALRGKAESTELRIIRV